MLCICRPAASAYSILFMMGAQRRLESAQERFVPGHLNPLLPGQVWSRKKHGRQQAEGRPLGFAFELVFSGGESPQLS